MIIISPAHRVLTTCFAALLVCSAAVAEVQISVTITGTAEELVPILQLLKDAGIATQGGPDIQVHSVFEEAPEPTEAPAPMEDATNIAESPSGPGLAFAGATVQPASVPPGGQATLTVTLKDPENKVDTVAATVGEATGLSFDLYDNGTHGDAKAGDGTWTYVVTVPAGMAPGDQPIQLVAFDAYGDPVIVEASGEPLVSQTTLTVKGPDQD